MWFGESHIMNMWSVMSDLSLPVAVKWFALRRGLNPLVTFCHLEGISVLADVVSMWRGHRLCLPRYQASLG